MSLASVSARMLAACERAGRSADDVELLVVSKGRSIEAIRRLYEAGHLAFGENRAQELRDKVPELPADVRWHFIGPLQTNKVRVVRPAVVALHSMDRESLAFAWLKGQGMPPPVYVEVNVGNEPQKAGVAPQDLGSFCDRLAGMGVPMVGLMAIPPVGEEPEDSRPHFARLRSLRDTIAGDHPEIVGLSMGMTDDFEVAIEEGATVIRVGRAIFES